MTDPIEAVQFDLYADDPVDPEPSDPGEFYFPVDAAVRVETAGVEVPTLSDVFVRTTTGDLVAESGNGERRVVPAGDYVVEVGGAPLKLYLAVESGLTIRGVGDATRVEFGEETSVAIGARSLHEQPAGTVTVPDDPRAAMRAVSLLGSALKTLSPERSFPTLRGHPPLVETGDAFDAPAGVEAPDTGVHVEVPPRYESVFPVTSLAYYLGAEVVPGETPLLVADGEEFALTAPDGFEAEVERVLKRTFFLDCVARTEGYYRVDLHERRQVEPHLDVDLAALYDAPLAERVAAHLAVPHEVVEPHLPAWKLTTDVVPAAENVDVLPFAARDLAVVRCPAASAASLAAEPEALTDFYRDGAFTRSTTSDPAPAGEPAGEEVVGTEATDSLEHAWVGDGVPVGASKATTAAYRRRASRSVERDAAIDIRVVCNDAAMAGERVVERLYGDRDRLQFDVCYDSELSRDELRGVLAEPADFFHYVGHVDRRGVQCADGFLDARSLDDVAVESFLLNACRSYEQGQALVEAGAIGGIVTLRPVGNAGATRMGRALAKLLNCGFSLRSALSLARGESLHGEEYVVLGDGNVTLVQSEGLYPTVLDVSRRGDRFEVTMSSHPSEMGGLFTPHVESESKRYLSSGTIDTFTVTPRELREFLDLEVAPVVVDGELHWSDEIALEDV